VYPTFTIPFCTWLMMGFFKSVPRAIEEAAIVDGCSLLGAFVKVILPIMMVAMLFGLVFTFTDMSVVYLVTKGGPTNSTQVLGSLAFQVGILSGDVGRGAAISLYFFPFLLVATFFLLRYLRRREI
ncbi:MAG TPA: ABC transporter permease subunit, partial [Burkholderiales bacterium]|nr:ABC transporter permease subunit [Burkholderiales bacterium]